MREIEKFSFGVGDRFGCQAEAQLSAFEDAAKLGIDVVPVWNKSHREHTTIGSSPDAVREAADAAIDKRAWRNSYYVDADHINLDTVDGFLACSDFFTIDVAGSIGQPPSPEAIDRFVNRHPELVGEIEIEGVASRVHNSVDDVRAVANQFLLAVQQAGDIYRHIATRKDRNGFVTEVSMDETDDPQTPRELLVILAALGDEEVPVQTIAPKFTGRFNKGVDYVGNVEQFEREFRDDLAVIRHATSCYNLPRNLKLSVHSGSDKFSLYAPIQRSLRDTGAGLHLKTAGTTWLEELIGLAEAGGSGLELAKDIYAAALAKRDALCAPYAAVIDIDAARLPAESEVRGWSAAQFVAALRHDPGCSEFNANLRQLLHVGYKIAGNMGERYLTMLREHAEVVARNVKENILDRHIKPLFPATRRPT